MNLFPGTLDDGTRPFSVLAAARERPAGEALLVDGAVRSWADLADLVRSEMRELAGRPELAADSGRAALAGRAARASRSAPRVALVAHLDERAVVQLLALIELGHPVVLLHPRSTPRERVALVDRAPVALWIDGAAPSAGGPTSPVHLSDDPLPATLGEACLAVVATSGSTGEPRAVSLSHRAFAAAAAASAANLGVTDDDRWLLALPFAHVGGLSVILRSLRARRAVVLATAAAGPSSPATSAEALATVVERDRVTLLSLVPAQLHRLLDSRSDWRPPASLRAILVGGAAASPLLFARARARGLPVLATYGLSESCAQAATQRLGATGEDTLAPPLPGVELRITDEGAIALRGPSLCSGYLDGGVLRPALDEAGWLVTRDAGELDPRGHLRVLGRLDEIIVTAGEKLHPGEVERALEGAPGIAAACAFAVADAERGAVVAAALVAEPGVAAPTEASITSALSTLARWKWPRLLAWLDALPTGATGKVDRRAVAGVAAAHLTRFG